MDQSITLSYGARATSTTVSNIFIDNYMTDARGSDVKVYLYLLRCLQDPSMPVSIESIAEALDETEKDIRTSLKYWDKQHVLSVRCSRGGKIQNIIVHDLDEAADEEAGEFGSADDVSDIALFSSANQRTSRPVPAPAILNGRPYGRRSDDNISDIEEVSGRKSKNTAEKKSDDAPKEIEEPKVKPNYSMDMIQSFMDEYPEFRDLVDYVENALGKTITTRNLQTVSFIFEELGFPTDLIRFLYDYCIEKGKRRDDYIEKVAREWHSKGITTIDGALKEISEYSNRFAGVKTAFGLNRPLLDAELPYVKRWYFEFGFSDEMVKEACDRTVLSTSKTDFRYANKLLKSWHDQGIKTLEEAKTLDISPAVPSSKATNTRVSKSKTQDFAQRVYTDADYLAFEKKKLGIK